MQVETQLQVARHCIVHPFCAARAQMSWRVAGPTHITCTCDIAAPAALQMCSMRQAKTAELR